MIKSLTDPSKAEQLFEGFHDSCILSCLQGIMGKIYADDREHPRTAMAVLGDFCFPTGIPRKDMLEIIDKNNMIIVPQRECWNSVIEEYYGERAKKTERYAMKKEPDIFDRNRLQGYVSQIPQDVKVQLMDRACYEACKEEEWSRDLVGRYPSCEEFVRHGLGAVVIKEGRIVSGVASYSHYQGGIEIEVDTRKEYRRMGFATAASARLILACMDRGLYPSWDAQNMWSVGLAQKLGYHFSHAYRAYEVAL